MLICSSRARVVLPVMFWIACGGCAWRTQVEMDQSSPKSLLESIYRVAVAHDFVPLLQCIEPAWQPVLEPSLKQQQAYWRVASDIRARLEQKIGTDEGRRFWELVSLNNEVLQPFPVAQGNIDWAQIEISTEATGKAVIGFRNRPSERLVFVCIKGRWYIAGFEGGDKPTPEDVAYCRERDKELVDKMLCLRHMRDQLEKRELRKENFSDWLEEHESELLTDAGHEVRAWKEKKSRSVP